MNQEALPLFCYPTTWICIDDDYHLLNAMNETLSAFNFIKLFKTPLNCLDYLNHYAPPSSEYPFLKSVTDDEHHGVLRHTPIDFDITQLAKLADDKNRHEEITAMVIDYSMPEMDGLSLAKKSTRFRAKKILLTGKNKEIQAIQGFNRDLIQRFVKKFEEETDEILLTYLKSLTCQYFQELTSPLLTYLETENKLPLSDPVFVRFFKRYCEEHDVREFYLIDKEGSFLLINKQNERSCLVVRSHKGIDNWLATYNVKQEISREDFISVENREKIPFFGVGVETWEIDSTRWGNYFYPATSLEGRERYFWAVVQKI